MARIDVLPSIDIIRGLKGILDFYVWRGLPCVRAWPQYRPARQTPASLAAALLFGAIVKAYSLLGDGALEAYRADAADHNRTARDIMVSGVFGNLHEASMTDFLNLLTECRDFLSNLTALLDALHSIDTDELVVRVEHSVLPDTAATAAAQATQLTALQKIDDLQDALESKALDRLLVRGMDQLLSYKDTLNITVTGIITGANGFIAPTAVPANTVWLITCIATMNQNHACTGILVQRHSGGLTLRFYATTQAIPTNQWTTWTGLELAKPTDTFRCYFPGALAGDTVTLTMTGHTMTLET